MHDVDFAVDREAKGDRMMAPMLVFCPICRAQMDWHKGYGRDIRCCGRACHDEAESRRTLSILGKEYRPREPERPVAYDDGTVGV